MWLLSRGTEISWDTTDSKITEDEVI